MDKPVIKAAARTGLVNEYYFSTKLAEIARMRQKGIDIISLGIGSPDMPPAAEVIEELGRSAAGIHNHGYQSYRGIPQLRGAFANWYGKYFGVTLDSETEILPLIGSKEGIMHISMAFLDAGDEVLVPDPAIRPMVLLRSWPAAFPGHTTSGRMMDGCLTLRLSKPLVWRR